MGVAATLPELSEFSLHNADEKSTQKPSNNSRPPISLAVHRPMTQQSYPAQSERDL